ncbi:SpoIIE family protein phosphatase [Streptomyces sp. NPDC002676]
MESDPALQGDGATPEVLALAKVVTRLRAEVAELTDVAAMTAVVERAKGVVIALEGVSSDAAYERLRTRAEHGGHTLLEECWITLGGIGPGPAHSPTQTAIDPPTGTTPETELSPFTAGRHLAGRTALGTSRTNVLAEIAESLAGARTPDDVAELLLRALGDVEHVAAIVIYTRAATGSLELVGHSGIDDVMAEQWSHIPPLAGVAALAAVADGEALWLENPEQDASRYLLIVDPAELWPTRAWLPVPGKRPARAVVGLFRTCRAPFDTRTRTLLRRAVRLCAEPLNASRGRRSHAVDLVNPVDEVHAAEVQRIFDALTGPAVLLTPLRDPTGVVEDFRIDAAAPESVDVAGRRGKELVGRRVLKTYPTMAGTPVWSGYLTALLTGSAYESGPFRYWEVLAGVPRESTYSVRASRLGDRLVVSWTCQDTNEREARRLADMQRLGNLGWVSWNLMTGHITWSDQVYTIFGRAPALGPITLDALPEHVVPDDRPGLGEAVRRLLDDGISIDEPFRITVANGVRHLRIVAEAQADADGAAVEVHGFLQDLTALRDAEIALGESERAVLVQRGMLQAERVLADRLRETLLPIPEQSLELADVCVNVAYVAADRGVNVGGDWYSAIELPDGSALFVVGDVAGHSLAAVGAMAELRFTAKGMAITGSPLPDVLQRLNTLVLHTAKNEYSSTATVVMAYYSPPKRRLTWVRAGHLPPLLIRGGEATFLPQPEGIILGAAREPSYGQSVLDLLPEDHLLLYTDGLVEEPGEKIEDGLERFAETTLRLLREGRGDTLATALAATRPHRRDDICVLDIHLPRRADPRSCADQ